MEAGGIEPPSRTSISSNPRGEGSALLLVAPRYNHDYIVPRHVPVGNRHSLHTPRFVHTVQGVLPHPERVEGAACFLARGNQFGLYAHALNALRPDGFKRRGRPGQILGLYAVLRLLLCLLSRLHESGGGYCRRSGRSSCLGFRTDGLGHIALRF